MTPLRSLIGRRFTVVEIGPAHRLLRAQYPRDFAVLREGERCLYVQNAIEAYVVSKASFEHALAVGVIREATS